MKNVLVLCTGNSCRSVIAEALINHLGAGAYKAFSAGSKDSGFVHPKSIETLKRHGINAGIPRSKSWDEFKDRPIDILITVCDAAADEACPIFPGKPIKTHWGVSDPAHAKGTQVEIDSAFSSVFMILKLRVKAFLRLPLE